jgi:hypothetical protein
MDAFDRADVYAGRVDFPETRLVDDVGHSIEFPLG